MLRDQFYRVKAIDHSNGVISGKINLYIDHPIYTGHFPKIAVTPGVCQIEIIKEILNFILDSHYHLKSARDIKFPAMITPENIKSLDFHIEYEHSGEDISVKGNLKNGDNTFIKLRGTFGEFR